MRLATLRDGTKDGQLVAVSPDGTRYAIAPLRTLQEAMERWTEVAGELAAITDFSEVLDTKELAAPLPRAWQWLDGSVYASHGALMDKVLGITVEKPPFPMMYQGVSDTFHGPRAAVPMADEELGIDFEGEFGIITKAVPMGTPADKAGDYIALVVQINDWSLRVIAPVEMKTGFGWVQAKPACSMAPLALTPDELGPAWRDGRIDGRMRVWRNEEAFGDVPSSEMAHGFHELIAHAARTRELCPGTIIGSGTVSSSRYRETGSCCIAERRAIETGELQQG